MTPAVREIYLRYAQGGAGMIVLEATGVREVASGPLLRLSHDRFVPGLRELVRDMKAAAPRTLVVPQIIDFLKIARRQPTRAFVEGLVRRGQAAAFPPRPKRRGDRGRSPAAPGRPEARARPALRLSADHRGPDPRGDPRPPRRLRGRGPAGPRLRLRRGRAALRPRLHHGVFSVDHERAHRRLRRELREPAAAAPRGDRGGARRGRPRAARGVPLPGIGGHPGRGRASPRQRPRGGAAHRRGPGPRRSRLPLHLARGQVRRREAARGGRSRLPLHGPQRPGLHSPPQG